MVKLIENIFKMYQYFLFIYLMDFIIFSIFDFQSEHHDVVSRCQNLWRCWNDSQLL